MMFFLWQRQLRFFTVFMVYRVIGESSTEDLLQTQDSFLEENIGKGPILVGKIMATVLTLSLSGLISGLYLAVMSFDILELRCIIIAGTPKEQEASSRILPIRQKSNYLLSAFVLSECASDAATTLLIESMTSDWIALLVATLLITIFGGIIPEAVTYRYGLKIAGMTMCLTHTLRFLTFPLAYPVAKLLDVLIGEDMGHLRNRKYLSAYVELTSKATGMCQMEVSAVKGTLSLKDKSIRDIMTPLRDVFMLDYNSTIDQTTLLKILQTGYSRIPIFRSERHNIVGLLHIKEIAAAFAFDMSSKVPVSFMLLSVKRDLIFVDERASLSKDYLIKQFERGTHLAFVVEKPIVMYNGNKSVEQQVFRSKKNNRRAFISNFDHKVIGIITLEDVVEEILMTEIVDETDTISDNKKKEKISKIYMNELMKALELKKNETPESVAVTK